MLTNDFQSVVKMCPRSSASETAFCTGSGCMAWRWHDADIEIAVTTTKEPPAGEGWTLRTDDKGKARKSWSWGREWPEGSRRGFCGLAGAVKSWNTAAIPAEED